MEKKKKKHTSLLMQFSIITVFLLVISLLFTSAWFMFVSIDIYLSSKAEMLDHDIRRYSTTFERAEDIEWFVGYVKENTEEFRNFITMEDPVDYSDEKYSDAVDIFFISDADITELDPETQRYVAKVEYNVIGSNFIMMKETNYSKMMIMDILDENTAFLIAESGENEETFGRCCVNIEYDASEHSAVKRILDGRLNEYGKVLYEEYYDCSSGKHYYNAYTDVIKDGSRLFTICLQYDWSEFRYNLFLHITSGLFIGLFMLILFNGLLILYIYKRAISPVVKVKNGVQRYMRDKDSEFVAAEMNRIKSRNEVGVLAESFSYMASEIDRYIGEVRTVTAEKERIDAELDMAAGIQLSQLPRKFPVFPERTEFDIFASMTPAKEVGGDFYDFFLIDDNRLALVIADVSGKGVPAALFMMSSKMLINNYALFGGTPAEIISAVNGRVCENNSDNMFVTVWLGILEISTGKMTCCNAGHEYPVIKRAGGGFELVNDKHGLFVGTMPGIRYTDYEIQLDKGDTLFVYTDGVPEATNAAEELFGNERMLAALNSAPEGCPLDELLQTVKEHVDEFVGDAPQFDDLTMLAIRYNDNCGAASSQSGS